MLELLQNHFIFSIKKHYDSIYIYMYIVAMKKEVIVISPDFTKWGKIKMTKKCNCPSTCKCTSLKFVATYKSSETKFFFMSFVNLINDLAGGTAMDWNLMGMNVKINLSLI